MFNLVDIITPTVDINVENLSFDPDAEENKAYTAAKIQAQEEQICHEKEKAMTKDEKKARDMGFDLMNVVHGQPVYIRRKVYYQGHAATTYSLEQATNIIDFLGKKYDSEDCLPFAVKLIENGQLIAVAEDNGEFSCGKVLSNCLKKVEGFNVLVCVTRHVQGSFVTDILQPQKSHAVQEAAHLALAVLYAKLTGSHPSTAMQEAQKFDGQIELALPSRAPTSSMPGSAVSGQREIRSRNK
jgi:hypothetical protein